ncbi:DUF4214 domain-containing protein [Massilia aurea]|uniref:DUF4214 domain-containing protein n=1 Tax=Massilia aurea TaxID=373040 RepID=UPI0034629B7D
MPSTLASTVNSFYLAFYGRPADPAGLAFWTKQLADNDGNLSAITQAFATSEEAQVRYGADTVNERIGEIYQALFNRAPDATGLAYWTNVVEQGHASVADVAVAIMGGAQGIDKALTALRQSAVDAFTAQVEASGTEYSGYASVEAARILVRAVTVDTATGDIDALVKAAVSFADTATKTPQVVNAIATGSTLLALFDTARGKGDPVALAQTLADTAKAAAGNPVTLESLLRGGGMDQVLKVMPYSASLKDVVAALAAGGLPAAIEVVYPTAPVVTTPAPTFSLSLAFDHVAQGEFDQKDDNVTNKSSADVTFSYTGRDLRSGQHFEYSIDGKHWIDTNIEVDANTNTVVLKDVKLGYQFPSLHVLGNENVITTMTLPLEQITTVSLRAVDASGASTTPVTQKIVYDGYTMPPYIELATDSHYGKFGTDRDLVTNDGTLNREAVEEGATVEYLVKQPDNITTNGAPLATPVWTATPQLVEGVNVVEVRVTDAAGNRNYDQLTFTLDTKAPETPDIVLHTAASNGATTSGLIDITGLEQNTGTAWEYSLDKGKTWLYGDTNDGSGTGTLELTEVGAHMVQVRQYDLAGNIGKETTALGFTVEAGTTVEVSFDEIGISLTSGVAGDIFMVTNGSGPGVRSTEMDGRAIAGTVQIGAQSNVYTGTFEVFGQNGPVLDNEKGVYTLGTNGDDFIENVSVAWGFDGKDSMFGTDADDFLFGGADVDNLNGGEGHDILHGGAGNDIIIGGADGDQIFVVGGFDTLYYGAATDSNLSTYIPNSQSATSIDIVVVNHNASVLFNFGADVAHVVESKAEIVGSFSGDELYAALTTGYNAAKITNTDAVIFTIDYFQLLVVNNGDTVIDDQDIVIAVIGYSNFSEDFMGNVLYGNMT